MIQEYIKNQHENGDKDNFRIESGE
jgi:hypothetical protein